MKITYPHTIENGLGETLVFKGIEKALDGDRLIFDSYINPGKGPLKHTHWVQDESLSVVKGRLAYQVYDRPVNYAEAGETIIFKRGTPHRFWNDSDEMLCCEGWIKPAHTAVFFLSAIYAAQHKSGNEQPEQFDSAYLLTRYSSEYDLPGFSPLVRRLIVPATYYVGRLLGKYKHFKNAPAPVKDYVNYYL